MSQLMPRPVPRPAEKETQSAPAGKEVFKAILPEDIEWKPFAAFPPSVRLAVVVGQPSQEGPYTIRVKVPHGVKLMPHKHPEDRVYTVISGVLYIGLGDQFDAVKLQAFPPGSVIILPGNTSHFHWAKSGEYVTQVTAMGPLALNTSTPRTIRGSEAPRFNAEDVLARNVVGFSRSTAKRQI